MTILFAAVLMAASQQTAPAPRLISYEETLRCAGLTQAASELEGGESERGRTLFDAALYWSLAVTQAAEASGRTADDADAELTRTRIDSVRRLGAGGVESRALLQACLNKTPDLG